MTTIYSQTYPGFNNPGGFPSFGVYNGTLYVGCRSGAAAAILGINPVDPPSSYDSIVFDNTDGNHLTVKALEYDAAEACLWVLFYSTTEITISKVPLDLSSTDDDYVLDTSEGSGNYVYGLHADANYLYVSCWKGVGTYARIKKFTKSTGVLHSSANTDRQVSPISRLLGDSTHLYLLYNSTPATVSKILKADLTNSSAVADVGVGDSAQNFVQTDSNLYLAHGIVEIIKVVKSNLTFSLLENTPDDIAVYGSADVPFISGNYLFIGYDGGTSGVGKIIQVNLSTEELITYWTDGAFRSCGGDFYNGIIFNFCSDVTPIRIMWFGLDETSEPTTVTGGGTLGTKYWTSFDQKIAYADHWWTPKGIRFDSIQISNLPKADSITLEIDNTDNYWSDLVLASELRGKPISIYEAALDNNNAVISAVLIFYGFIDSMEINQSKARVEVYNHMIKWKTPTPKRIHSATCQWQFKNSGDRVIGSGGSTFFKCIASHIATTDNCPISGANWPDFWVSGATSGSGILTWTSGTQYDPGSCQYKDAETWCDLSYDRCVTLGQSSNFGGFRWLPSIVDQKIWWGKVPA